MKRRTGVFFILLFCLLLAGCVIIMYIDKSSRNTAPAGSPEMGMSIEERVNRLLAEMTLEEKIGQMTQADRSRITPGNVRDMKIGSVLSGGGSVPVPNTPESWRRMYNSYQAAALDTRLGIPLIYGIDSVHGHNNLNGATIFPHNIGLGAARDLELVEKVAEITALETAATGLDWSFSPVLL